MHLALRIRVLAWIAGAWLAGLFIGAQWQPEAGLGLAAVAFLGAMALTRHAHELYARLWAFPLSLMALLAGLGVAQPSSPPCSVRGEALLTARVESVRHGIGDARLRLRVTEGRLALSKERLPPDTGVRLRLPSDRAPPPGSVVMLRTRLHPPTELRNPSPHPKLAAPGRGACWAQWDLNTPLEITSTPRWRQKIDNARKHVRRHMNEALPQDVAGVARALVLGDGGALSHGQRQTIAAVGLAHLFAVSGLHVALVSGTLVRTLHWLLRGATIRFDARRVAATLGIPLTLLHALFAGGSPSAWRAAITAALTWGLIAVGRRPSAVAVTAAAALLLSAPNPAMALRPAFLLSIVATSAILSAPRVPGPKRWRRLRASAITSARTLVATTPMVWWWFGGVPLIGWLTNILVLPFGSLVVIPLAHLFALTSVLPDVGGALQAAVTIAVNVLLSVCDAFAPLALTRRLPPLGAAQGLTVLAACVALLVSRTWRHRFIVLAAATLLWLSAEHALVTREQPSEVLRMTFLDVGQGDATLIDFPDRRLALVDTGQGDRHPAGREILSILEARRRARIDLVVITHGHPDHYGALRYLLNEVQVGEVWINGQLLAEERDGVMDELVSLAGAQGARVRSPPDFCGASHDFGGARLVALSPCPRYDAALGLNDNSITLRIDYGQRSFLLTGDLEAEAETLLLRAGRVHRADVLKVAHHGSKTSTTEAVTHAVRPAIAVISVGGNNPYGHPSPKVIERLHRSGARVLRTDVHGGIVVSTNGQRLEADTWRGDQLEVPSRP